MKKLALCLFTGLTLIGCEPIRDRDGETDSTAILDQKPVTDEGWEIQGEKSNRYNGLQVKTAPTKKEDMGANVQASLNPFTMKRTINELDGLSTGTARLIFSLATLPKSGISIQMEFATGSGLPAFVQVTDTKIVAKCGTDSQTHNFPAPLQTKLDYPLVVKRQGSAVTVAFNEAVVINQMGCTIGEGQTDTARSFGFLNFKINSQMPLEKDGANGRWSVNGHNRFESNLVLRRITVYQDATLPEKKI